MFDIREEKFEVDDLKRQLVAPECGGFVCFEGWVRDHHQGRAVKGLRYTVYRELALKEGRRIIDEAHERWPDVKVCCVHRVGMLDIGDLAVWVGASSAHRNEAFEVCRFLIDEVKSRVPIWKEEFYADGTSEWMGCSGCASGK